MPLHQGEILKRLIDNQSKSNGEIAALSGIAISSLYNYYSMEEIPLKKLKMLSAALEVDMIKTFINPPVVMNDDGKSLENEMQMSEIIKLLKLQIEQQNEILKLLKKKK